MSKLMWIAGILLIAVGIALGLMVFVSTAAIIGWGIDLQVAATLLVGGILSLGLGSVISGLDTYHFAPAAAEAPVAAIPEFGRRGFEPGDHLAPVAAMPVATVETMAEVIEISGPVKETIEALEQARQKIEEAFEPKSEPVEDVPAETPAEAEPEAAAVAADEPAEAEAAEAESAEAEVIEDGQLYVVEERLIRARPARILSDGTVEAETTEGWMRFENLEHLDEYLDAMSPAK